MNCCWICTKRVAFSLLQGETEGLTRAVSGIRVPIYQKQKEEGITLARLLKISEAASIAMHALILLAEKQGEQLSNRRIAEAFNISANHSSKVLQRLIKSGFVDAVRGPGGGYSLAVNPEEVSLLDVYRAVDGEPDDSTCLFGRGKHCALDTCLFSEMMSDAEKLVQKHLGSVTLAHYMDRDIGLPTKGMKK